MNAIFYTVDLKYNSIRLQTELLEKILSRIFEFNSIYVHSVCDALKYKRRDDRVFITYGQYIPGLLFKSNLSNVTLIFHNITPAKYFLKSSPLVAILSIMGYIQLFLLSFRNVKWVAVSDYNKRILERCGHKDVLMCPNIIDKSELPAVDKFKKPTILYVGRIVENKNCLSLLEKVFITALKYQKECDFYIIGKGKENSSYLKKFERLIQRKPSNLTIQWLKGVSYSELISLYQKSWLYVTMSKHEGFGLPVCESLTYGTPAIYTKCGGQESIMNNIGLCKENEIPDAILSLITNKIKLEELYNKEIEIVKKYQEPIICETIEKVYGKFLLQ